MAKIVAPNKMYEGISAGIKFSKGVGDCTDPYLIDWFKSKGYEVVLDASEMELPVPESVGNPVDPPKEIEEVIESADEVTESDEKVTETKRKSKK
jgi:hypothetical protein